MKRHPLDAVSLFFGALFSVLGGASLLSLEDAAFPSWTLPLCAIAIGALIVGLSVRPRHEVSAPEQQDATVDHTGAE